MATQSYTVTIQVNSQGGTVVVENFNKMAQGASKAQGAVFGLRRAFAALGIGLGVREMIQMVDSVTELKNRMSLLSQSTANTGAITHDLFQIAKDTRSEFDVTAKVYTRMALAARTLGVSQADLLSVTRSLNQAVILSGSNSREAANGLIQLSQAIASNRLGGDELRSVLEQLPLVADIIGVKLKKMGLAINGTRGEVRQLGFEGKITADIIIQAFLEMKDVLEEQFKNTIPTIGQAFTYLTTSLVEFVSGANEATGGAALLAQAIKLLADNLTLVADVIALVTLRWVSLSALSIGVAFVKWVVQIRTAAITLSTVASVLGGWITLAVIAIGVIYELSKAFLGLNLFGIGSAGGVGPADAIKEANDALKDSGTIAKDTAAKVVPLANEVKRLAEEYKKLDSEWFLSKSQKTRVDELKKLLPEKVKALQEAQHPPTKLAPPPTADERKGMDTYANIVRKLTEENAAFTRTLGMSNRERAIEVKLTELNLKLKKGFTPTQREFVRGLLEEQATLKDVAAIYDEVRGPVDDYTQKMKALNRARTLHPDIITLEKKFQKELEYTIKLLDTRTDAIAGIQRAELKAMQSITDHAANAEAAWNNAHGAAVDYAKAVDGINQLLIQNKISQEDANRALVDARISYLDTLHTTEAGAERALLRIRQEVTDSAKTMEDALVNAFHNAESALEDLILTGENGFKDVAKALQKDLLHWAVNGAIGSVGGFIGSQLGIEIPGLGKTTGGTPEQQMATAADTFSKAVDRFAFTSGVSGLGGSTSGTSWLQDAGATVAGWLPSWAGSSGTPEKPAAAPDMSGGFTGVNPDGSGYSGYTPPQTQIVYNVTTPDANSFQRSQNQILARQSAAQQRAMRRNG